MENDTPKCLLARCQEPAFDGNRKCIFHCDKYDWREFDDKGQKNWEKSEANIRKFWGALQARVAAGETDFKYFIFPPDDEGRFFSSYDIKTIGQKIDLSNSRFLDDMCFASFSFENDVVLDYAKFEGVIEFETCVFKKKFDFQWVALDDSVKFKHVSFESKASLLNFYAASKHEIDFVFYNLDIYSNFDCIPANMLDANIAAHVLRQSGRIGIPSNGELASNVDLENIFFSRVNIFDKATFRLDLLGCKIQKIIIEDSNTIGIFHLANVEVCDEFNISKTMFSKSSVFDNIQLKSAEKTFKETFFGDTIFVNLFWGDKKAIKADREHFRQLKLAYDKQANYIEANEFYALEMKAREEELKNIKLNQDKFVFWLGGFISNHSTDWLRALKCIFGFGVLMFFWYQWRIDKYIFDANALLEYGKYSFAIGDFLDEFAKFMNPFSKKIDDNGTKGYAIWLTHKVFSGFLIYHFIVSLRRNTKR